MLNPENVKNKIENQFHQTLEYKSTVLMPNKIMLKKNFKREEKEKDRCKSNISPISRMSNTTNVSEDEN